MKGRRNRMLRECWKRSTIGLVAALALLGGAGTALAAASEDDARAFVQSTIDQVMGILRSPSAPLDQKKDQVEQIAYQRFDFELISKLVLARNWDRFTPQQKSDLIDAFQKHLSATYRDTLNNFKDESITIVSSRAEKNGDVTVMTIVKGATDDTKVDYRLRKSATGWQAIDVIIEGVSLVQNFRSQAQEIVSTEGPDGLIQKLRDKQIQSPGAKKA
jgi:phospholipid transport system substrate-binding protein